jgi:uncharacterized ion transporter superfamily protein YfcC
VHLERIIVFNINRCITLIYMVVEAKQIKKKYKTTLYYINEQEMPLDVGDLF